MKILLLSRYDNLGASSRYRSYQYIPYLERQGIKVTIAPLFDNKYIKELYYKNKRNNFDILKLYIKRIKLLHNAKHFDLVWIEKEALPWLPAWIEHIFGMSKIPYIVDYDDAIFNRYNNHQLSLIRWVLGNKIDQVMRNAKIVIAGNDYIADKARKAGARRVEILPTVVNLKKYSITPQPDNRIFTIGWIGTPVTSGYIKIIAPALKEVCKVNSARLVLVGATKLDLPGIPVEYVSWSEDKEINEIQKFDVGIMPLPDEPWERGKCGFKLIQYMACGRSVVGSPVGINRKIIQQGINGYQATSVDEWILALNTLKNDYKLCRQMGEAGRKLIEREYCLQVTAPRLRDLIFSVVNGA